MKNLYHLLVTSYKLHVTSYKLRVTNLLCRISDIGYRISFIAFCFLPFSAFAQSEATISDLDFSCPGIVTVTYDLDLGPCNFVDVTLYYSSENCGWVEAITVTGDLTSQTTGNDKTIVWDAAADHVSFGKFYFKVEYALSSLPQRPDPEPVLINGVRWAPVNLDVGGVFCTNPWDFGGLFQWGRPADGHECRTSPTTTILSSTNNPGHGDVIIAPTSPNDWRNPQNNLLWNSGTDAAPVKTANDPCPDGWRVPTRNELEGLLSTIINGSGPLETYNGITGRWFSDGGVSSLFLPTALCRLYSDGSLYGDGSPYSSSTLGQYWSSAPFGTTACILYFNINMSYVLSNCLRANVLSVRCVKQ